MVGPTQRGTQIDVRMPRQVGAHKQQVTQFLLQARLVAGDVTALELLAQFLQFLGSLVQQAAFQLATATASVANTWVSAKRLMASSVSVASMR